MGIGAGDSLHRRATAAAGSFRHGWTNYFCRYCGGFTSVPVGAPDPARCATPGCRRPYGFGTKAPTW